MMNIYVVVTETVFRLNAPPTDRSIVRIGGKNTIINDDHVVNVLNVTDKNMLFLNSVVGMHIINSNPIVEACDDQLFTDNVTHVDRNFIPSNLFLVPEQDHFVFVTCDQNATQHQSHTHRLFVIRWMSDNNVEILPFNKETCALVPDEEGSWLQIQITNRDILGLNRQMHGIRSRH